MTKGFSNSGRFTLGPEGVRVVVVSGVEIAEGTGTAPVVIGEAVSPGEVCFVSVPVVPPRARIWAIRSFGCVFRGAISAGLCTVGIGGGAGGASVLEEIVPLPPAILGGGEGVGAMVLVPDRGGGGGGGGIVTPVPEGGGGGTVSFGVATGGAKVGV